MVNIYSGEHEFKGYKSLSELSGLTFTANTKYVVQAVSQDSLLYIREGSEGKGDIDFCKNPFDWTYDGENDLYIGSDCSANVYVNVSTKATS